MRAFLQKHLDDVLIVSGCGLLVLAAWLWNVLVGILAAGVILIALGVLVGLGNGRQA